ncbi:FxSxx-COOH system tetratricopeptide repeat protein [Saccharothrix syringae]|uniref:Tetratricopeptide repeat protein n=1 Tax=Saccharothrix syringae TaxID=103733 RepID=A0A5Q0H178_SACSY|nr:FxSxx-COOH system tetratricopeptide repeat protein [Saccharothrix syringae]QFZ19958.1 tetratricopeptide repeat protein [Saccharothrix syringae]
MGPARIRLVAFEVALAFAAGLVVEAAGDALPSWLDDPRGAWSVLLALLVVTVWATVRRDRSATPNPPVWKVELRNPNFTGRRGERQRLARLLGDRRDVVVCTVRGMAGIGKTQLAVEFCHRRANRYAAVWWLSAEDPALIPGQLVALGRALGLALPAGAEEAVSVVLAHLRVRRGWLLVFDNAETVAGVRPYIPTGPGHVLLTTRRAGFEAIGSVLVLDTFQRADSVALLRRRVPAVTPGQAAELAGLLGDLPLALEQAAAYLTQTGLPVPEYLALLRRRPGAVRGRVWELPLSRIERDHPASARLLAICAHLAPDPIPLDLFTADTGLLPPPLRAAAEDPDGGFGDAVGVLVDYSLAQRSGDHLVVHRMIQLAARATPGPEVGALLEAALRDLPPGAPATWPRWRQLLPHVLAGVAAADPRTASRLLDQAGTYLLRTGQLADAEVLLRRALRAGEEVHGPDRPELARLLNNLGNAVSESGRPAEARPLLERALAIGEAALGLHHPEVAVPLNNLGLVLRDLGRPDEALPLHERALAVTEARYGSGHPLVAARLNALGLVLGDLGRGREAIALHERALAVTEAGHGIDHPDVAVALSTLGLAMRDIGRLDDARCLLARALAASEAAHGADHPEVATALSNLGLVLRDLGPSPDSRTLREARPLLERALAITEAAYGPGHPKTAVRLNDLGLLLRSLGQPKEALPLHSRALAITEAVYGSGHPRVAVRLTSLAGALRDLGRPRAALPLLERALDISRACHGPDHPEVAARLNNLGLALSLLDRADEARPLFERAREIRESRVRAAPGLPLIDPAPRAGGGAGAAPRLLPVQDVTTG